MNSRNFSKLRIVALFVAAAMTSQFACAAIHTYTFEADLFGGAVPTGIGSFSFDDTRLVPTPGAWPGSFTDPAGTICFETTFGDLDYTGLELSLVRGGPYKPDALDLKAVGSGSGWVEILLRGPFQPTSNPSPASDLPLLFDAFADNISDFPTKQVEVNPEMIVGGLAYNTGPITSFIIAPEPTGFALASFAVIFLAGIRFSGKAANR